MGLKFSGFKDWIEIFRGGRQVDSEGRKHDGDALIDKAVKSFDANEHEPPVVIGHPKDNAPAYGWVKGLKTTIKDGVKVLLMKAGDVVPEFENLAKQGLYKKRSASFYPDGRLRHVGFLGAAPPAVKGLADLQFDDQDDAVTFEFYDPGMGTIAGIFRRLRDYFIEKEGAETANTIIPDWDVEYIREQSNKDDPEPAPAYSEPGKGKEATNMAGFKEKVKGLLSFMGVDMSKVPDDALPDTPPEGSDGKSFTEADLEKIRTEAEAKGKKDAETEFAEKQRQDAKKARDTEISDYVAQGIKDGKILPAWKDAGLTSFMQRLDAEEDIEFAEGGEKKTNLDWFKDFLEGFGKLPIFKEMAKKDKASSDFSEGMEKELGESIAAKANR